MEEVRLALAKFSAANVTETRYLSYIGNASSQSLESLPVCSFPSLFLFAGAGSGCVDRCKLSGTAQATAIRNLERQLEDVPFHRAPQIMACNAMSTFQCLIHANFLHYAKSHLQGMKRANKVVDSDALNDSTIMDEARRLVSSIIETPTQLLEHSVCRTQAVYMNHRSKLSGLPVKVMECHIEIDSAAAHDSPDAKAAQETKVPINLLMTTAVSVGGAIFSSLVRCRGTVEGTYDDCEALNKLIISINTRTFLSSLRNQARLIVLEAVAKGFLEAPQNRPEALDFSLGRALSTPLHLISPPTSPTPSNDAIKPSVIACTKRDISSLNIPIPRLSKRFRTTSDNPQQFPQFPSFL